MKYTSITKSLLRGAVVLFATIVLTGCDAFRALFDEPTKPGSKGAAYELIVVCNQPLWEGEVGDTLRSV